MKLTKDMADKAKKLIKNWDSADDTGIFLDDNNTLLLERVPEWANNWTALDLTDIEILREDFNDFYDKVAPRTLNEMLKETTDFKFVIENYDDDTDYLLNEVL